jgi:hypothetical protein
LRRPTREIWVGFGETPVSVSPFFDGLARTPFDGSFGWADHSPDAVEHAVVLTAVKDAARR